MNLEQQARINSELLGAIKNQDAKELANACKAGAQIQTTNYNALVVAAATNNKKIVKYLVEKTDYNLQTGLDGALLIALVNSYKNQSLEAAKYLKSKGAGLNPIEAKHALMGAIAQGDVAALKYIMDNWSVGALEGGEVIDCAAKSGLAGPVQFLIENYSVDSKRMHEKAGDEIKKLIEALWERQKLSEIIKPVQDAQEHFKI